VFDGWVEVEGWRSRIDKESDKECKEEDGGDGDDHMARRLLRF